MQETKATGRLEIYSLNKGIVRIEGEQYWLLVKNQAMKDIFQTLKKGDTIQYTKKYSTTDKKFEIVSATKLPVNQATVTERIAIPTPPKVLPYIKESDILKQLMEATIKEVNQMVFLIDNVDIRKNIQWNTVINTLFMAKVNSKR